ncbi:MAG: radical SAM protein [Bowdeniella nasicola]|nr:radical SAM protein [Bowdeniella nasicola]
MNPPPEGCPPEARAVNAPPGRGMPLRGDRIHRYVTCFCPHCHEEDPDRALADVERLSGWLAVREGRVWLERGCPHHGWVSTLYDEDAEILTYLEQWTAPTKVHIPDEVGNFRPIPEAFAYGLPEVHTQHTCILLQDVTEHCNIACPTCFASASPRLKGVAPLEAVLANIDTRLARENGHLDVLMLSGGEPTLYPRFAELLNAVVARPITRIMVNTNGLTLAKDEALADLLGELRERVEVYLQFDGLSEHSSRFHRGGDLRAFKARAIENLTSRGVFVTLTMAAALGVNDDEIGAVIDTALDTPFVGGVALQPVFGSGRSAGIDPGERLTHTGVLRRIGEQTERVDWRDLTALPCSHPHCASVGYLLRDDAGTWRSLTRMIGHERLREWLDLEPDVLANRVADTALPRQLRATVTESLRNLLSEQNSLTHPDLTTAWRDVCSACDFGISTMATLAASSLPGGRARLRQLLGERVVRITVKPFMDIHTMIEERLTQCCVHVGTASPGGAHQCAPFCAVQAWGPLSRSRLSVACGSAPVSVPMPTVRRPS